MKECSDFLVVERKQLGDSFFSLKLQHPDKLCPIMPGQFVEVRIDDCAQVMLRRPISIHDVDSDANTLTLLIQIVGNGTRRLASLVVGEHLNLVYPLGHGFTTDLPSSSRVMLVGGGAGIAPLFHLAKVLSCRNIRPVVLLGGRSAALIPVSEEFSDYADLYLSTDDGSIGHHGLVTTHPRFADYYDFIFTCGPTPMMKAVARHADNRGIRCEVSLENMMACGVGACLCCVTDTDLGHQCVCKQGPVFDISMMKKWFQQC